jgi:hypothetical protein
MSVFLFHFIAMTVMVITMIVHFMMLRIVLVLVSAAMMIGHAVSDLYLAGCQEYQKYSGRYD